MSVDVLEFAVIVTAAVLIVGVVAEATRITLRGDEPDAELDDPISQRAVRKLCNRVDTERAANPDRQS